MQLCQCGCKQEVSKEENKYVNGHNSKGKISPNKGKTGEKSHFYKHGKSKKLAEWRANVLARDNFICQNFSLERHSQKLIAHHILPKETYPELIYDVNNGLTLCWSCHSKHHNKNITEATRQKISESKIGDKNPMYAKSVSTETRKLISLGNTNKTIPILIRKQISKTLMGHDVSEETREKISKAVTLSWKKRKSQ